MVMPLTDDGQRRPVPVPVLILVLLAMCWASLRIGLADAPRGDTASLSANDRSRWSTVAALVHHGSYVVDDIVLQRDPVSGRNVRDKAWYSIDQVRHKGRDGKEHYYSSKPTLFPTLMAGKYWLLNTITGWDIRTSPHLVIRTLLLLTNLPALVVLFFLGCSWARRYCQTGWSQVFAAAIITWGTFLTTFANTLNNHLIATAFVAIAFECCLRILERREERLHWYLGAGFCAAMATANELPVLALLGLIGLGLVAHNWRTTLVAFAPPVLLVGLAFFGTNWLAHNSLQPAYAHRSDGAEIATISATAEQLDGGTLLPEWMAAIPVELSQGTMIIGHEIDGRWIIWDRDGQDRLAVQYHGNKASIHEWNNWYDYSGTHWVPSKSLGFDAGEPSRLVYAFQLLIGHHGVFSLTPIWLLSIWGGILLWRDGNPFVRRVTAAILLISLVVFMFYVMRPLRDRNYGGNCCGPRWLFWLIPFWFYLALAPLDRLAIQPGRRQLANLLLLLSVVTSIYAFTNPWQPPWLYTLIESLGLLAS
jgi:hypothetical protein